MRNAHDGMVTHLCNIVTVCHDMKRAGSYFGGGEGALCSVAALVIFSTQTVLTNVTDEAEHVSKSCLKNAENAFPRTLEITPRGGRGESSI